MRVPREVLEGFQCVFRGFREVLEHFKRMSGSDLGHKGV